MEIVHPHGAGLDGPKKTVVAAIIVPGPKPSGYQETRTFGTMTADLLALRDWLHAYGVTHVALESTGVYWKPVYYMLEDAFTLLLINRQELQRGLSKQSFMLFPKMREVDGVVRSLGQGRLREGHPEVSFAVMNGGASVLSRKREPAGRKDRIELLQAHGFAAQALVADAPRGLMAADDVLDATALLWSAGRMSRREHITLPPVPSRDAVGLEMSVIA